MEFHFKWFFYFGCDTASNVGSHVSSITDSETVWRLGCDFGFHSIELGHALDFSEDYDVSIVQSVLLLIMKAYQTYLLLGDSSNVNVFSLLSGGIEDSVSLAEVNKGVAIKTKISSQ